MAIVRCDVCNGIFSQSYLAAHKRLAHGKRDASPGEPTGAPTNEKELIQKIASLYDSLSVQGRKRVIRKLIVKSQKVEGDPATE
jgi:hypothetical protein